MIQVREGKTPTLRKNIPGILSRTAKTQKLENGNKSSGWYCHGNTNQQQPKIESLLSHVSLEKTADYAPNKDHAKYGAKKVLVLTAHFRPRLFASGEIRWKYLEIPKCCLKSMKSHVYIHMSNNDP